MGETKRSFDRQEIRCGNVAAGSVLGYMKVGAFLSGRGSSRASTGWITLPMGASYVVGNGCVLRITAGRISTEPDEVFRKAKLQGERAAPRKRSRIR